jgi:tetratricopeptide (TPR) repeat protein
MFQEARALALHAVKVDPRNPQGRFALGLSLYHTGQIRPALDELQETVRLNPSDAAAHANLAFVYNYLNRAADARTAVELALRLSPQDPRRFIWLPALAGSHYLAGNYTEALRAGHEALTANPRYLPVVRYIVASLGQLGQADAAKTVIPLLRKLDGDLAGTRTHLRDYFVAPAVEGIVEGLARAGFD